VPAKFVSFTAEEVPALAPEHCLLLNVEERIVTMLNAGHVCAQGRFSRSAFRLLGLLLRSPCGAEYVELLACLSCTEAVFRKMLMAASREQAHALLAPQVERWSQHLERAACQGAPALEKELKIVRRALKERSGASTILQKNGFALTIRTLYRKGYLLTRTPAPQCHP
jgi:hypothetical protein